MEAFLPVGILLCLALAVCGGIYVLTTILGPKVPGQVKLSPYECGVQPEGDARRPFQFKYYLVAVLFLLFDVEGAFFLPWALVYRNSLQQGPGLLIAMLVFGLFFVLALFYVFRKGYLEAE